LATLIKVNPNNPECEKIKYAAEAIKQGKLVAFPTETVYGLGANALNRNAVLRIFKAKGRPLDNPIIVHVGEIDELLIVAREIPSIVFKITSMFWPGPLTLILKRSEKIPKETCGGRETVAVRMPAHKVALALVKEAGIPIAAPSANLSGRPSPTSVEHVLEDLKSEIEIVLDGGETPYGIESTVLDVTKEAPLILRPGPVTPEALTKVLSGVRIHPVVTRKSSLENVEALSPGMKYRHYAPKAQLILFEGQIETIVEAIREKAFKLISMGERIGIATTDENQKFYTDYSVVKSFGSRARLEEVARNLYKVLRELDHEGVNVILCEGFEEKGLGLTIMNRLRKASGGNIVKTEEKV
jgi:L-threonylcarbamoyladenylate synthase